MADSSRGFVVHTVIEANRSTECYEFACRRLVNVAGLEAQDLATRIEAVAPESIPRLHLCKGDYFDYRKRNPFKRLIYPLPEANTSGLGIHATLDIAGQLRFGPDTEYIDELSYEIDPAKAEHFTRKIAHYFPAIEAEDLKPAYSGVRPKLAAEGEAAADYCIQDAGDHGAPGLIQLFGMESPALTSSLAIAQNVVARLEL